MPLISVIVPVYKVEPYLRRCVDSILAQTFKDFELILVDDGSPDNCGAICDEYMAKDSRIRVFHQKNKGQAAARNLALDWVFANSDSEYIGFVDSDDWVHPRYLELLLEGIQRYQVNICQCGYVETDGTAEHKAIARGFSILTPDEQYTQHYSAFMWDKLFARKCWDNTRFPEGQVFEDVAIWYKMLFREEKLVYTDAALYYYFINPESTVRRSWTPARLAQIDAWEDQLRFFRHYPTRLVRENAVRRYVQLLDGHYWMVDSSLLPENEKKQYQKQLKKKLQFALVQYWRDPTVKEYRLNYLAIAYPKIHWLYWFLSGIQHKLFSDQ